MLYKLNHVDFEFSFITWHHAVEIVTHIMGNVGIHVVTHISDLFVFIAEYYFIV